LTNINMEHPTVEAAAQLRRVAERHRALARTVRDPRDSAELLALATECEALAQEMEARIKAGPSN
jgi:hypothetical protein